ncbi:MAG: hypothetical protein KF725_05110 [Cyclobacteriaceae bacterium]|nr:hypothetical protein [Cyclobacteriaceae bacterium]UYN85855.1 MAG: hypothetical protein KIT51_13390 [Cyclobacteriaceae bacterium]
MKDLPHPNFSDEQLNAIKKSYFNILGFFLQQETIESRFLRCLLKWGIQLNLHTDDLVRSNLDLNQLAFNEPREKIESLYHLVYLINLDNIVEDVELEVASLYAEKLGFAPELVGELFKSIATVAYDQDYPRNLQKEIEDFMKLYTANS